MGTIFKVVESVGSAWWKELDAEEQLTTVVMLFALQRDEKDDELLIRRLVGSWRGAYLIRTCFLHKPFQSIQRRKSGPSDSIFNRSYLPEFLQNWRCQTWHYQPWNFLGLAWKITNSALICYSEGNFSSKLTSQPASQAVRLDEEEEEEKEEEENLIIIMADLQWIELTVHFLINGDGSSWFRL